MLSELDRIEHLEYQVRTLKTQVKTMGNWIHAHMEHIEATKQFNEVIKHPASEQHINEANNGSQK